MDPWLEDEQANCGISTVYCLGNSVGVLWPTVEYFQTALHSPYNVLCWLSGQRSQDLFHRVNYLDVPASVVVELCCMMGGPVIPLQLHFSVCGSLLLRTAGHEDEETPKQIEAKVESFRNVASTSILQTPGSGPVSRRRKVLCAKLFPVVLTN